MEGHGSNAPKVHDQLKSLGRRPSSYSVYSVNLAIVRVVVFTITLQFDLLTIGTNDVTLATSLSPKLSGQFRPGSVWLCPLWNFHLEPSKSNFSKESLQYEKFGFGAQFALQVLINTWETKSLPFWQPSVIRFTHRHMMTFKIHTANLIPISTAVGKIQPLSRYCQPSWLVQQAIAARQEDLPSTSVHCWALNCFLARVWEKQVAVEKKKRAKRIHSFGKRHHCHNLSTIWIPDWLETRVHFNRKLTPVGIIPYHNSLPFSPTKIEELTAVFFRLIQLSVHVLLSLSEKSEESILFCAAKSFTSSWRFWAVQVQVGHFKFVLDRKKWTPESICFWTPQIKHPWGLKTFVFFSSAWLEMAIV